jgi:transcriptional regulator GlxA family with amidase domain
MAQAEASSGATDVEGAAASAAADFAFVIIPRFSMMAFASAIEPLRIANRLSGRDLYRWQVVSVAGGPVRASNGVLMMTDQTLADITIRPGRRSQTVVVCCGLGA